MPLRAPAVVFGLSARCRGLLVAAAILGVGAHGATVARATTVTEFPPLANADSLPAGVTAGPDGNVWFTELNSRQSTDRVGRIGRLTPTGDMTEYPLPTAGGEPNGITTGPDGNLWFAESGNDKIGRITPSGTITEYPNLSTSGTITSGGAPHTLARGSDNALWFTEGGYNTGNRIGRLDPLTGAISEYCIRGCNHPAEPSDAGLHPGGLALGPDGNIWFTEANPPVCKPPACTYPEPDPYGDAGTGYIASISPDGKVTEYALPAPNARPTGITAAADGALWFTERGANAIGRITTSGSISEYPIPTANSQPTSIAAGADGNVWFIENGANKVGRITPDGTISEYAIPKENSNPGWIAAGPGCALYFTEVSGNRLAKATTDAPCPEPGGTATEPTAPPAPTPPAAPATSAPKPSPRLNLRRVSWGVLTVRAIGGISPAITGRVTVAFRCAGKRAQRRVRARRGRWVALVRLPERCRRASQGVLRLSYPGDPHYKAQALQRRVRHHLRRRAGHQVRP